MISYSKKSVRIHNAGVISGGVLLALALVAIGALIGTLTASLPWAWIAGITVGVTLFGFAGWFVGKHEPRAKADKATGKFEK